jgi:REP element-mobilizing transposase RayT
MEQPTRKNIRLTAYDYSAPGAYFITVCTKNKENLFWSDVGAVIGRPENVPLNHTGQIVDQAIKNIPNHYPAISADRYVIMPNHIHLLLQIRGGADGRSMIAPTISTVVRSMKGFAVKQAGIPLWQKGFYDHIIRSEADYLDCWQYIEGNPGKRDDR